MSEHKHEWELDHVYVGVDPDCAEIAIVVWSCGIKECEAVNYTVFNGLELE